MVLRAFNFFTTPVRRYGLALCASVLGALTQALLESFSSAQFRLVTFFPAVAVTSSLAGRGPGILATLVSVALLWLSPLGDVSHMSWNDVANALTFIPVGIAISIFNDALRRTRIALKESENQLEQSLQRERLARSEAEEANQSKDVFLATLSHELRTPLTSILGWTSLLKEGVLDNAQSRRAYDVIDRNALLQNSLITDLLDVSRIVNGKMTLSVQPLKIDRLVISAIETIRPTAQARSISISSSLHKTGFVEGDATRLQQVLSNLFANALKFTPPGGRIEVRISQTNERVKVQISDTGKGISPDFLPFVFDRFRQAEAGRNRSSGGLGLGLAIVRHIVQLHGGVVSASSEGEGKGATFCVELPLVVALTSRSDEQRVRGMSGQQLGTPLLADRRVLVVEDDDDARELIVRFLSDAGADATAVSSVSAARAAIPTMKPDVLVSDISLPGEDGYQLIQWLRSRGNGISTIPAIAVTAYGTPADRARVLASGFQVHLLKPLQAKTLVGSVVSLLAR